MYLCTQLETVTFLFLLISTHVPDPIQIVWNANIGQWKCGCMRID